MARRDPSLPIRPCSALIGAIAITALGLGLADGAAAATRCFPEVDDEVIVFFEAGALAKPIVVGALWNGQDAPPEATEEVSVLAPRHLAAALMETMAARSSKDLADRSVGTVVRELTEQIAKEVAQVYFVLDRVYEAGFVESARSEWGVSSQLVVELIGGVFEADVDTSIQQMKAYAELLAEVSAAASGDEDEGVDDDTMMMLVADLIDLDLSLRDPDCD